MTFNLLGRCFRINSFMQVIKSLRIPKISGLFIVVGFYLIIVVAMLPFRQVGFLDDFSFHHSVRNLVEKGRLEINDWAQPSLITQVYWGALFAKLFGMNYKSLHLSVVVLFFFGIISFYLTLRELKVEEKKSVLFSLLFIAFPTIIRYTFSFMTVIPYISLMFISILFAVRAIKRNSVADTLLASIFSSMAFLTRQLGILIPLSLFLTFIVKSFYDKKLYLAQIVASLAVPFATFKIYEHWVWTDGNMTRPQFYKTYVNSKAMFNRLISPKYSILRLTDEIYWFTLYKMGYFTNFIIGILVAPFLLMLSGYLRNLLSFFRKNWGPFLIGLAIVTLFHVLLYLYEKARGFPYGVLTEAPFFNYESLVGRKTWIKIWDILTVISIPSFSLLLGWGLASVFNRFFEKRKKALVKIIIATSALALLVFIYFFLKGFYLYKFDFIKGSFFMFFLLAVTIISIILFSFYRVRKKIGDPTGLSVVFFLVSFTAFQLTLSSLGYYYWQEYILPVLPTYILLFAVVTKKVKLSLFPAFIVVLIMLYLSLSFTKKEYDNQGIYWEMNEELVSKGLIDAREASVSNWAWIPYFFQEEAYQKELAKVGGNKNDLINMRPWWSPEYEMIESKVRLDGSNCDGSALSSDFKIYKKVTIRSLFEEKTYCVSIKEK